VASLDGPRTNDTLTYTYDELGRITNRALNSVGVTWAYDARNWARMIHTNPHAPIVGETTFPWRLL
jgi:hypothetical protein